MPRLLMLTRGELTRDPRARRAAQTAASAGYDVVGVGGSDRLGRPGGRRRSGPLLRELRGIGRVLRLAASTLRLARAARRSGRFEIVHAHDFETLPAARLVSRRRTRLVYDAHELYADQEPDAPHLYRALVRMLEGPLARRADAVVTVSDPIAEELERSLRLGARPIVVLSCPPTVEIEPAPRGEGPLRALYQGAMGPGRRLADLVDAAAQAEGMHLTVRVVNADLEELEQSVAARGLEGRIEIAAPAPPDRLVEAAAGFHVGLVINRPVTRNDELVLPNKLFEYLMAGLAVVVPRLPSLAPLVEGEGVGLTYEPSSPDGLGAALTRLAQDGELLGEMRERARRLALERYNAEAQAEQLELAWRG